MTSSPATGRRSTSGVEQRPLTPARDAAYVGYGGEPRQVFRCAACLGRGYVACGFYGPPTTSTADEPCRSCGGREYVGET